jgi:hypothetical protein
LRAESRTDFSVQRTSDNCDRINVEQKHIQKYRETQFFTSKNLKTLMDQYALVHRATKVQLICLFPSIMLIMQLAITRRRSIGLAGLRRTIRSDFSPKIESALHDYNEIFRLHLIMYCKIFLRNSSLVSLLQFFVR